METVKKFKLIRDIRAEITDPQKTYDDMMHQLNSVAQKYLGMDTLHLEFSFVNRRFIFLLAIMSTFLYADVESAVLAGDVGEVAYNIAVLGIGLQGFAKFDAYVYRKESMHTLVWQISAFLNKKKMFDGLNEIVTANVAIMVLLKRFYIGLYGFVFVSMSSLGLISSLSSGERQLSFGFQFSFLDTSNWVGYLATYIYQVAGILMVVISSCCNDILIVVLYITAMGMYDCMMFDLRELSKLSQMEKSSANKRIAEERIKSVIQQHQEVLEFLELSNETFSLYFLMSLVCMTAAIAILLVALVWNRWYAGLVICFAASSQIFALSLLGTLLLVKSEELIDEVYSITWYDMDLPVQRSLKLFLLMSQHVKEISYRFGVMNMETYVQSHKMIYSFFTMLVTAQE
ncbi:AAEL007110-PA [Aedes aegypti]|uniref:Odorant receptor n=2 Tax=Aedes aegypti TaxID=7159 RepID=A0A1S7UEB6_AEDAE|nr:AAEL007110-PA [Aedes aegypti]DAA80365.1 TPA_exp: odorant receptor 16 [Aedes aegypti]